VRRRGRIGMPQQSWPELRQRGPPAALTLAVLLVLARAHVSRLGCDGGATLSGEVGAVGEREEPSREVRGPEGAVLGEGGAAPGLGGRQMGEDRRSLGIGQVG
jgi:hypothetical protein